MWAKRDYLELAFYPTSTHLNGELFCHLRFFRHDSIPLEKRSSPGSAPQYRLAHARQLYDLETTLFSVRKLLSDKINFLVGLDKTCFPGPSSESYTSWFLDEAKARNRAFFARKKFLYHIAMISFYIAIIAYGSGDRNSWYSVLLDNGVPGPVADKLSLTMVADFSPNIMRAGVFIYPDNETSLWEYYVRVLISANVPVYISWGPIDFSPSIPTCFKNLYPTEASLKAAVRAYQDDCCAQGEPPLCTTSSLPVLDVGSNFAFPPAEPLTDEPFDVGDVSEAPVPSEYTWKGRLLLPGEQPPSMPKFLPSDTPASFFFRRAAARNDFISTTESPHQKTDRLVREENARRYLMIPKGPDEVYEWDFNHDTMRWVRILVPRQERQAIWSLYQPACKRYDPVAGEWDLAIFLDYGGLELSATEEHALLSGEGDKDYDSVTWKSRPPHPFFREGDYQIVPPIPQFGPPHDHPAETMALSEPTEQSIAVFPPSAVVQPSTAPPPSNHIVDWDIGQQEVPNIVSFMETLLNFLAFRWGSSEIKPTKKRLSLQEACKAVGFYTPFHGTGFFEKEPQMASTFIAWVSRMLDQHHPPPADWWLLHPDSVYKLKRVLKTKGYPIRLSVIRNEEDGTLWWCIHKQSPHHCPWTIVIKEPTAAAAAMQSRQSWEDTSRWMVASGMSPPVTSSVLVTHVFPQG